VTDPGRAVFLSYASQDTEAAQRLCNALRAAGIEVWFDQSELRAGDAWDALIRQQIKGCYLFVPIISASTQSREEGYFRREWNLAVARTLDMAEDRAFLLPVVIDGTSDSEARVPVKFREVQWTHLTGGATVDAFVEHVHRLLAPEAIMAAKTASFRERSTLSASAVTRRTPARSPNMSARSVLAWVAGGILIIATGYFIANKAFVSKRTIPTPAPAAPAIPDKSVAVLPFLDMSEKKDQEYFSDGLSEELINQLGRAPDLKVIARTSSFQFKGKNEDTHSIGQRLGVANLLEGSVRKSGNKLRIAVQLVRADTGYHVWSETYDRKADDVFKIQDEIAAAVLQALKGTLLEGSAYTATGTPNMEAYALYLQGHAIYQRANTQSDYDTAIDFFRRALKADPNYARAWAALSSAITVAADNEFLPLNSAKQDARQAAERALALDPGLADTHIAMARYLITMELDVAGAQHELRRALELEPNGSGALSWAGKLASWRGQFDQATALIQRSISSDPLDPTRFRDLASNYYYAGEYVDALNAFHKALTFLEDSKEHCFQGAILLAKGDASAALKEIDREGDEKLRFACTARALALDALGRNTEAGAWLTDMIKNHADDGAYAIALFYASRGKVDEAFSWFDRAYRERDSAILNMKVDPLLKNVQTDLRFAALLKKLGLER
jgi:TolB-like protein/Tfp pilus assembly protein PilF